MGGPLGDPGFCFFRSTGTEVFVRSWEKNPFNFAHMNLNSACLVVEGHPLLAQPWQQGLYAEAYHAFLRSSSLYPSDWSNDLIDSLFMDVIW